MMKYYLCILLMNHVWLLCPAVPLIPSKGYFIVLQQLECITNPQFVANSSCVINSPRNRSVNAELRLMQSVNILMATVKIAIPNPKKKVFQKIFDITFDMCKVFRERKRMALIDLLSSLMHLKNSTLRCPIHEGLYRVHNVTVAESLPPVLTESPFILNFNWFMPRTNSLMNITAHGHLYDVAKEQSRKKKRF